nr:reverse transcriptase domain-containing protein [Tanacetum cinerariifolium]
MMVFGSRIRSISRKLFLNFFKDKFQVHDSQVVFSPLVHSTRLCPLDREYLETHVSLDEIKSAIWDCGSNKALSLDGFTFAFVKKYRDLIKMDILEFVNSFFIRVRCLKELILRFSLLSQSLGFGNKWRSWIRACLHSSRASVLVNGSPTLEFSIKRGDFDNIIRVLHVFYLATCLKININKSNIYGIGVSDVEVSNMASNSGCVAGSFPFTYLGFPIGSTMNRISSWKALIDRFQLRLSSWKACLLSIGGRLTLVKAVLGCLGLNIGSLKSFNLALLQKWRWRWFSFPNALWVKVIKAIHGQEGGFDTYGCKFNGIWARIVGSSNFLHSKNIIPLYQLELDKYCLIIDRIENGKWSWNWSRNDIGVRNTAYFRDLLIEISRVNISTVGDTCIWSLAKDDIFSVKEARRVIDNKILPSLATSTSWDKILPRKVNIFMWRLMLDRLPHRLNLSSRGIDIQSISCPSCNGNVESSNHIFFECDIASEEEEEEEKKEESEKKGSKEASEIGSNSKPSGYAAIDNEVESDLESTARSEPKCKEMKDTCERRSTLVKGGIYNYGGQHNYTCATTQMDLQIVTQVTNNVNNANANGGNGGNNGCSYKTFLACNSRDYDGKGDAVALTRWIEKMESVIENSGCVKNQKVKYAASSFINKALTWWNTQVQARGHEAAIGMSWVDLKGLLVEEFYPSNEMEMLESEFYNHTMVGANHAWYTDRFHELAKLVPHLVTLESKHIKRYINGLPPQIHGMLLATQPTTIQSAILKAGILTDEAVRCGTLTKSSEKRKEMEETSKQGGSWKNNKKAKVGKGLVATAAPRNENVGSYPKCDKCSAYHPEGGPCRLSYNCQKPSHSARDCWASVR